MSEAVEKTEDSSKESNDERRMTPTTSDPLKVIATAGLLDQVIGQLKPIVDEAIFRMGHNGLDVACVDPANVGMIQLDIDADAFESVGDGLFPIGLDLGRLEDYLHRASGDDLVSLRFEPETGRLHIEYDNRSFDMAAIDPSSIRSEPDIPELELPASWTMDAMAFRDAVEDADIASDHVIVIGDPDAAEIRVLGKGDSDKVTTTFGHEDVEDAKISEDAKSMFSTKYLVGSGGMLPPIPSGASLDVALGNEYPLRMAYEFEEGRGEAFLMLAPRIQSD